MIFTAQSDDGERPTCVRGQKSRLLRGRRKRGKIEIFPSYLKPVAPQRPSGTDLNYWAQSTGFSATQVLLLQGRSPAKNRRSEGPPSRSTQLNFHPYKLGSRSITLGGAATASQPSNLLPLARSTKSQGRFAPSPLPLPCCSSVARSLRHSVHRARPSLPAPSDLSVDHAFNCNLQGPETLHVDRDHGNLCASCWHEPYE